MNVMYFHNNSNIGMGIRNKWHRGISHWWWRTWWRTWWRQDKQREKLNGTWWWHP